MATNGIYGSTVTGPTAVSPGAETSGLYGQAGTFGGTYFEWFVFQVSATAPATPTGGSWNFSTNVGTPPSGWVTSVPAPAGAVVWVSIAVVNSRNSGALTWSTPGVFGNYSEVSVGTTTTGAAGSSASVVNSGTSTDVVLDFTIPRGDKGDTGDIGPAATIAVGSTTTTNPGTNASVVNVGTSGNAIFDFEIPRGAGVNSGGTAGQVLTKASGTDYDTTWTTIIGTLNYQGSWNASTNTPTLASSVGTNGYYYVVSVAGSTNLNGITDWQVGDWAIFNGSVWQKIDQTNTVTSVNGQVGVVNLTYSDVGAANAGANTNITSMSGITGGIATADYLQLDTAITPSVGVGKLQWDTTWNGPQIGMGGGNVNLQIGQETLIYVHNNTGSALSDGQVVYVTGSQGQRVTVALAQANSDSTSAAIIGMVTEPIADNASGFVTTQGMVNNINTSGASDGAVVYLSPTTPGAWTTTKPVAPNHMVMVGYVVKGGSAGAGSIYINTQNGYELEELHNVLITSPTSGNTLIYDATQGVWENANISAGSGISVTNGAGSISIANTGVTSVSGTAGRISSSGGATPQIDLVSTSVTAGTYTAASITVDAYGRITSASSGVGGATISNDTTTATNLYPAFANTTSGNVTTLYTSNAKYLYKPSTGELQASQLVASNGLVVNSATVASDYSIPSGSNAMSAGPVSVASGVTVTVPSGSVWAIV